ncbi:MAG: ferritin-like domain-containing protein [Aeromonas veronii]
MKANALEVATMNTMALFLKAKMFHLNVTGPRFYGDHKTYDGIAEVGMEWYDILAERMRALDMTVCSCPKMVDKLSMMDDGADEDSSAEEMAKSMLESLEEFSEFLQASFDSLDATTSNMLQELDAALGKQIYFVRSSI